MTAVIYSTPTESPDPRLRILWIKVGGLWPLNSGGRLRSFHIIAELSRHHGLTVLSTHEPEENADALARHLPRCELVSSVPHTLSKPGSFGFIRDLLHSWLTPLPVSVYKCRNDALAAEAARALASGSFDLCIADFIYAVPNVDLHGPTPVVLFQHNVEYRIWQRTAANSRNPFRRALLALEWRKMRRYETRACRAARLTIAVSDDDRRLLLEDAPESRIESIPTGVDLDYFQAGIERLEQPGEIVFTGSMDWHPNEDAMLYFIDDILPLIRREVPEVTLTIVGRNASRQMRDAAAAAEVTVTGTVDDVRPYIRRAAVYVVPLRIGGGTRLKIYEALAMGKAVVSTTIGAEGLPLEEGVHLLRADDASTFAGRILELLASAERRQQLGMAGRHLMEQEYSWSRVAKDFGQLCLGLAK
jgi:glycosyltransferase involved in cell wall biosynthesis